MKTADIFIADRSQRSAKVIAGYRSMAMQINKITLELQALNTWVMKLPEYINDNQALIPDPEELADAIETLSQSIEKVKMEFSANSNATKHLEDVILFHNKYGSADTI